MNIPDHISESLETIFWAKNFFNALIADPDSGIFVTGIEKFGSGPATLLHVYHVSHSFKTKLLGVLLHFVVENLIQGQGFAPGFN
jgi:hypothetical protein